MPTNVATLCKDLVRQALLPADEVRTLHKLWRSEAGDRAESVEAFLRWMVSRGRLTEYQAGVIGRDNIEQLTLGPYRLLERIGKGRLAGVYKAVHNVGQVVAIKILPPSKAKDPKILARFQREARLARPLKHPNIVRTFQTGQARGLHFLVMECLEGESLAELFRRRGKLPPGEAARLVHHALRGLQHIHERGLVHRDLEPGNLVLVGGEEKSTLRGTVKIVDIGTGRTLFAEEGEFGLTNEGDLLGTAEYMAPEQARNPSGTDIRADIYSLGCVLFHALAGQPPFVEENRVRLIVRQATEPPRPIRELNPEVPDGLQQILNWMLAKDPEKRYPTPERAAGALQVFLAAGAEAVPLEKKPEAQAYLTWLSTQAEAPDEVIEEVVEVPTPAPPPRPKAPAPRPKGMPPAPPPLPPSTPRKAPAVDVELIPADEAPRAGGGRVLILLLIVGLVLGLGLVLTLVASLLFYFVLA